MKTKSGECNHGQSVWSLHVEAPLQAQVLQNMGQKRNSVGKKPHSVWKDLLLHLYGGEEDNLTHGCHFERKNFLPSKTGS